MDDGDPPLSNSSSLTVVLVDVDDIKPQFTHDEYQIVLDPSGYKVKYIHRHGRHDLNYTRIVGKFQLKSKNKIIFLLKLLPAEKEIPNPNLYRSVIDGICLFHSFFYNFCRLVTKYARRVWVWRTWTGTWNSDADRVACEIVQFFI